MPENRFPCGTSNSGSRETVLIETNRVLDSCRDRDCYENTRVYLTEFGNEIIERVSTVRIKDACIAWTNIAIDPVQFNRGFYSVDMRFYVKLCIEACVSPGRSQEFDGVAILDKRVILYGSESNVNIFRSTPDAMDYCTNPEPSNCTRNTPTVVVEAVDPVVLGSKIIEKTNDPCYCCCCDIPERVTSTLNGTIQDSAFGNNSNGRYLLVSLGLFSVVRIVRPAQYLINATEYNVPDKECVVGEESSPCNIFKSMAFPTAEFNPPGYSQISNCGNTTEKGRCGCQGN